MNARKPIEGKIAAILRENAVAINRGRLHGVTHGMKFTIWLKIGSIRDPEHPGTTLDIVQYRKGSIVARAVLDNLSVCFLEGSPSRPTSGELKYPPMGDPPLIKDEDVLIRVGDSVIETVEPAKVESPEGGRTE